MVRLLMTPPGAFLLYLALGVGLAGLGRVLAGPRRPAPMKSSLYASGEAPPAQPGVPGYRRFFVVALFFAMLHLGVIVLGSGGGSLLGSIYLVGLLLVLLVLLLG